MNANSRLFQYYEDELAYLASAGARFAKTHPERAALVSLDNVSARDPDVERLVQAFAFLAGQVRAELNNELPELTHSLLRLLWPHFLQMIPATCTVAFEPDIDQLTDRMRLDDNSVYVQADPITSPETGRDVACLFRNCFDIDLYPLRIVRVGVEKTHVASTLIIEMEIGPNADANLDWGSLRLHLAGDPVTALEMRHWLLRKVRPEGLTIEVVPKDGKPRTVPLGSFHSVGVLPADAVLERNLTTFVGHRLIQEYFAIKHKFLYVDIKNLDRISPTPSGGRLILRAPLVDHPPERLRFSTETIRLFCSPVVNLFKNNAIPIRYDGTKSECELLADHDAQAYAVYRVMHVFGQIRSSEQILEYQDFLRFRTDVQSGEPFYQLSVRPGPEGRPSWKIALVSLTEVLPEQIVSVEIECSNGELASALLPGDIRHRGAGVPDIVRVKSLTQPEGMIQPPIDSASEWRFISHLGLNYLTLEDADTLVGALKLYDWTKQHVNWRRLQGIKQVKSRMGSTILDGVVLRGREIDIELDLAAFTNLGDAYLFSEVLAHFLALYSNINSYVRLTSRLSNGEVISWPAMNGQQRPI